MDLLHLFLLIGLIVFLVISIVFISLYVSKSRQLKAIPSVIGLQYTKYDDHVNTIISKHLQRIIFDFQSIGCYYLLEVLNNLKERIQLFKSTIKDELSGVSCSDVYAKLLSEMDFEIPENSGVSKQALRDHLVTLYQAVYPCNMETDRINVDLSFEMMEKIIKAICPA